MINFDEDPLVNDVHATQEGHNERNTYDQSITYI